MSDRIKLKERRLIAESRASKAFIAANLLDACDYIEELEALVNYFKAQLDSTKVELAELRSNTYTPDHSRTPF